MIYYKNTNPDTSRDFILKEPENTEFVGQNIYYYDVIDSTNNEAKLHYDCPEGSIFIADTQTNGRGRKGRSWISDSDSLCFSVLLKPEIAPEKVFQITLVVGLAVSMCIPGSFIKWPNDIVSGNKKLAGILTEMSTSDGLVNFVVAGIGINVNARSFPEEISDIATSLYIQTGKKYSVEKLLADICYEIEYWYKIFVSEGFSACVEEYSKRCITINREVKIINANSSYNGKALGLNENGELIVLTDNGKTNVLSGEVSVRGLFGYA